MAALELLSSIVLSDKLDDAQFDSVLFVGDANETQLSSVAQTIQNQQQIDSACSREVSVMSCSAVAGNRLIYSPTCPAEGDFDDVRTFQEAAEKGIKRAVKAGCRAVLLVQAGGKRFSNVQKVTLLGALQGMYTPLEVREAHPSRAHKLDKLGVYADNSSQAQALVSVLLALESGRIVCRDIGGSDPERMAPPAAAHYVQQMFTNTCIKVEIVNDDAVFQKDYPLLAAVNRAARHVDRHKAQLIHLTYEGEGDIDQTLLLVGKGITYDTGGADLKVGGVMAGMHRDKCGAAFVAGFFQLLSVHKPKGLKVIGAMAMVRNSIGSDCYVSDEIITSRAGVRVRIGNTDAEGRMVMCDVLCHMKEKAMKEINPHLFTIATLTGHVIRVYGPNYSAALDNGPAWASETSKQLVAMGDIIGDPFEISRLRREDFVFNLPPSEYEEVVQANTKPSTMTNRGHQSPAAFLITASGLDKCGCNSANPLPYTHLDIAGSSGPFPGVPTGSPIVTMAHRYVLNRQSAA